MNLLWIDVETTGLDPQEDDLLQVGMIITDEGLIARAEGEWLIHRDFLRPWGNPRAKQMHERTRLAARCHEERADLHEVQRLIARWLCENCTLEGTHIAGNSVWFDRAFLDAKMPGLLVGFHHRLLDVSALRVAGALFGWPYRKAEPAHTALADIRQSVQELKYWRDHLREPPP